MPCQGLNPGVGTSSNLSYCLFLIRFPNTQCSTPHTCSHMPYNPHIQQVVPYTGHQHDTCHHTHMSPTQHATHHFIDMSPSHMHTHHTCHTIHMSCTHTTSHHPLCISERLSDIHTHMHVRTNTEEPWSSWRRAAEGDTVLGWCPWSGHHRTVPWNSRDGPNGVSILGNGTNRSEVGTCGGLAQRAGKVTWKPCRQGMGATLLLVFIFFIYFYFYFFFSCLFLNT